MACRVVYDKRSNALSFCVRQESVARPLYCSEENLIDGGNRAYKESPYYSRMVRGTVACLPLKIDARRRALRWAKGDLTIKTYETNGIDIKDEQYTVPMKSRMYITSEIAIKTKFRKPLNKKKEGTAECKYRGNGREPRQLQYPAKERGQDTL